MTEQRGMTLGDLLSARAQSGPLGDIYAEVAPIPDGACAAEEYPVWMDGSQSYVRCELAKGHDGHHHGRFTDDGAEWDF